MFAKYTTAPLFPSLNGVKINVRGEIMLLNIGETLAFLRKEKKITQQELADFVGVTKASVSKWENGVSQTKGY